MLFRVDIKIQKLVEHVNCSLSYTVSVLCDRTRVTRCLPEGPSNWVGLSSATFAIPFHLSPFFAGHEVCYTDRKDSKKRSFTKYAKLLTSTPKFVKEVKRYLNGLFF